MTRLEYLLDCKLRYERWLAMTPEELSKVGAGQLTHEKVGPLYEAVEDELIDYMVFDAHGRMSYSDEFISE